MENNSLHLKALNHISLKCRSLDKSVCFYQHVLGFYPVLRPCSLDFDGAWLYGFGIGIHLIQTDDPGNKPKKMAKIDPKNNHFSFQCESMAAVEEKLEELEIEYVRGRVVEGGICVDQLFFHDPDGSMIEICNCDKIPVIPIVGSDACHV